MSDHWGYLIFILFLLFAFFWRGYFNYWSKWILLPSTVTISNFWFGNLKQFQQWEINPYLKKGKKNTSLSLKKNIILPLDIGKTRNVYLQYNSVCISNGLVLLVMILDILSSSIKQVCSSSDFFQCEMWPQPFKHVYQSMHLKNIQLFLSAEVRGYYFVAFGYT